MMRLHRPLHRPRRERGRGGRRGRTASRGMACLRPLQRMGEEIGDGELARFARLEAAMEREFARAHAREREAPMRLTVEGAATRLEGPLLFLRRTLDVGLSTRSKCAAPTAARGSAASPRSTATS